MTCNNRKEQFIGKCFMIGALILANVEMPDDVLDSMAKQAAYIGLTVGQGGDGIGQRKEEG